ncbi:MAG: hypothetical protein HYY17_04350 [Planctomycetes bacterium]|nr:hypothetical protein [Planctomycetota bacterium]
MTLQTDCATDDLAWEGSPFAWIKSRPSRLRGKIGGQLAAGWCAARGLDVTAAPDCECDRMIGGLRAEVRFSAWSAQGGYTFQPFRDQRYDVAVCLGVSPFDAHCWVIPKDVLMRHVIEHTPQHTGARGRDTFWIHALDPANAPDWLASYGGRLKRAIVVLRKLARRRGTTGRP